MEFNQPSVFFLMTSETTCVPQVGQLKQGMLLISLSAFSLRRLWFSFLPM